MTKRNLMISSLLFSAITLAIVGSIFLWQNREDFELNPTATRTAYKNCLAQMQRKTCKLMFGTDIPATAKLTSIMIAGYGTVDYNVYRELKSSGIYMCETMKKRCDTNARDSICELGTNLFADMK